MEIRVAKTAGFCFGVKRAMDMVSSQIETGIKPIYTYGPIIHNSEVVKELESKGVFIWDEETAEPREGTGTIVMRSHGVGRETACKLETMGMNIVDATCPFVKKIHRIVSEKSSEGYNIIIAGNKNHPEVQGIMGWCNGPVIVISEPEEIDAIAGDFLKKACFVAQTTFNHNKFNKCVAKFEKTMYDILVFNSICNATQERQEETALISGWADCMLVVGDRHSSNTQKLSEIASANCEHTYFIQTSGELDPSWIEGAKRVGITAGASTPQNIIEEVKTKCQKSVLQKC